MNDLTHDQIREIVRCIKDPIYCLQNYVWMKADSGIRQFNVGEKEGEDYFYQKQMVRWLQNGERIVVLKNRRAGASWIGAFWAWYNVNFKKGFESVLVSIGEKEAISLLNKVKFIHDNLHFKDDLKIENCRPADFLKSPKTTPYNTTNFTLAHFDENGEPTSVSKIQSLTTTKKSGRGESSGFVFVDEANFIENQEEVLSSVITTAAIAGQWLLSSNAGSSGTVFHSLCMSGREKLEDKRWVTVDDPTKPRYIYREVWPDESGITNEMIRNASITTNEHTNKEWYLTFIQAGNAVFAQEHLDICYKNPQLYPEIQETIDQYRIKVKNGNGLYYYYSGVDSAVGKTHRKSKLKDWNCFTTLTMTGIQVYTYYDQKPLAEWAGTSVHDHTGLLIDQPGKVSRLHKQYPGLCQIEENGPGYTVLNRHILPEDGISDTRRVSMSQKTKTRLINQLQIAIESHQIVITDPRTYNELSIYEYGSTPNTFNAPVGSHDDSVVALALAWDNLLFEGGFALEFAYSADLSELQMKPFDKNYEDVMDMRLAPIAPMVDIREGTRPLDYMPLPFEDKPRQADSRFLPDMDLMKKLREI